MAAVTGAAGTLDGAGRADWARKYPPLLTIAVALLITVIVLPSALNLPQSNPTETLEYAPVPPDDESRDQQGNLASVGLGRSAGIGSSGAGGIGGDDFGPGGNQRPRQQRKKKRAAAAPETPPPPISPNFRCVGTPPRQTFDLLSPPCVPFFEGDNGCKTYGVGVDCNEVRLAILQDGNIDDINGSGPPGGERNVAPGNKKYDLFLSHAENNKINNDPETRPYHLELEGLEVWQKYFNERFQTYGRKVHFYVYYSDGRSDATPEGRRRNAETIREWVPGGPFAVVSFANLGSEDDFLKAMARKGVLNFGSFGLRKEAFFNQFPKMIWSYLPSVDQQVESYTAYICNKVVGQKPVLASSDIQTQNQLLDGGKRKLGIIHTDDPNWEGLKHMAGLVKEKVAACPGNPGTIVLDGHFPTCCFAQDNSENPQYAATQMAQFKQERITTILWAGGINGNYGKAATAIGYFPEWIVLGDGQLDANGPVIFSQNTEAFDGHAITVTPQVLEPALEQQICFRAYREIDQTTPLQDVQYTCNFYVNLFQFFVGVQVAGPYLGPTSIDKGFHAIPQRESGSPQVAACFYLPGDYTCVKDGQAEIWDADGRPPGSNTPGCWRAIEGGQRYHHTLSPWKPGNVNSEITNNPDNEPCNGFSAGALIDPT